MSVKHESQLLPLQPHQTITISNHSRMGLLIADKDMCDVSCAGAIETARAPAPGARLSARLNTQPVERMEGIARRFGECVQLTS